MIYGNFTFQNETAELKLVVNHFIGKVMMAVKNCDFRSFNLYYPRLKHPFKQGKENDKQGNVEDENKQRKRTLVIFTSGLVHWRGT